MIQPTPYTVDAKLLSACAEYTAEEKLRLNTATGNFFYDPWILNDEFKGTSIETVLSALPFPVGQARLIKLDPGTCYFSHSDIDDRYHLNLTGTYCNLTDLENQQSYYLQPDGIWYEMDAGKIHTAINAGEYPRIQLVVRKLLTVNALTKCINVCIQVKGENARYRFDNIISPWLNRAVKAGLISNFETSGASVYFDMASHLVTDFNKIVPEQFDCKYS
jgi:hypothetical protein